MSRKRDDPNFKAVERLFFGGRMTEIGMFDELVETTVKPDGTATSKRHISDEQTLREMEFAQACKEFVIAEKRWEKIDWRAKAQEGIPDNLCEWFDALEERYKSEKRLWELFRAGDRSPRSGRMYLDLRKALLSEGRTRADA
jgi:hypothetical protein